jgi:hypothetical protein
VYDSQKGVDPSVSKSPSTTLDVIMLLAWPANHTLLVGRERKVTRENPSVRV